MRHDSGRVDELDGSIKMPQHPWAWDLRGEWIVGDIEPGMGEGCYQRRAPAVRQADEANLCIAATRHMKWIVTPAGRLDRLGRLELMGELDQALLQLLIRPFPLVGPIVEITLNDPNLLWLCLTGELFLNLGPEIACG